MGSFASSISAMLPGRLRGVLRRVYRKLVPAPVLPQTIDMGSFGGYELAFRKGSVDENVIQHSFDKDIYFPGLPEYTPAPDHVMIDVGAHIGTFALHAAKKVPRGRVFAIEACRETYCFLRINAALNRADNITADHAALADKPGTIMLNLATKNWGHTIVTQRGSGGGEPVPALTLAQYMARHSIAHCHFMKLNCEGAEFPILLASDAETLRKFGVILVLYHCDLYGRGASEQDLAAHLRTAGFQTTLRNQSRNRGWLIASRP
ncbi:MAG: FkbM family methyltransferase [Planctomycetes bacterium]|nr:FkbM family methyltransferase [Planctomycetota bacterium]